MRRIVFLLVAMSLPLLFASACTRSGDHTWSAAEIEILRSLWIGNLEPPPPDPSNRVADDPRAIQLGQRLFFDAGFSASGEISCATCHQPDRYFTDGLPRGRAHDEVDRNTPTVVGAAYSPWYFWDGRKDSLWSQALEPLEHPREHAGTRSHYVRRIASHYRSAYEEIFGPLPDFTADERYPADAGPVSGRQEDRDRWRAMEAGARDEVTRVYVNMGKAIAAYERRLLPGPSRFDRYVEALLASEVNADNAHLDNEEVAGLRLFIGPAGCLQCHNGPLFSNHGFHNVGSPGVDGIGPLNGRIAAVQDVLYDIFNCLGPWSDAPPAACHELRFVKVSGEELFGAVRTPSLRNVAATAPYMSLGQIPTLRQVLVRYNQALDEAPVGHSDLQPLGLEEHDLDYLEAFLRSLEGPIDTPGDLLRPPPKL